MRFLRKISREIRRVPGGPVTEPVKGRRGVPADRPESERGTQP